MCLRTCAAYISFLISVVASRKQNQLCVVASNQKEFYHCYTKRKKRNKKKAHYSVYLVETKKEKRQYTSIKDTIDLILERLNLSLSARQMRVARETL